MVRRLLRDPDRQHSGIAARAIRQPIHSIMDHAGDGRPRDVVLGPVIAKGLARSAPGSPPADADQNVPLRVMLRTLRMLGRAWVAGTHQRSPFFTADGVFICEPLVLTPTEREALRSRAV